MRVITHFIEPNLREPLRTISERQPNKRRPVVVDGARFESLAEAGRHFGVKRQTIHWWLNKKKHPRARYAA